LSAVSAGRIPCRRPPTGLRHAHIPRNLERSTDHAVIVGERVSCILTADPSPVVAEIE
jgi:phosphate uptake regulator